MTGKGTWNSGTRFRVVVIDVYPHHTNIPFVGRYITIEDMKGLLGSNEGEDDPAIRQMWDEGLKECACPLGRITYDDFCSFIMGKARGTYQSQAQANVSESKKG